MIISRVTSMWGAESSEAEGDSVQTAQIGPQIGAQIGAQIGSRFDRLRGHRTALVAFQMMLVLGVASAVLLVAPRLNVEKGDSVSYAAWGVAMLAAGVAALLRGRLAGDRMKLRWIPLGVSFCGEALAYFIASANNFSPVFHALDGLMIVAGTICSGAMMLSIAISFSDAPTGIVLLDMAQAALFLSLSYVLNAGSNPWATDVQSHVVISLLTALVLFLAAAVAPLSASTIQERRFFKIVAVYLGAAWVTRFIGSQVGYLWMHSRGNLYDQPSLGVTVAMALFLSECVWQASHVPQPDRDLGMPRLMLRNLMPSLLAFASLLMALYIFLHAYIIGLLAVLGVVMLYLSRTLLLQSHMAREAMALRDRNIQLEEISQHDPLTGAGNRRSLAACYQRCRDENPAWIAMLLIDLDFFKQANDVHGHQHGDHILKEVADVLRSTCDGVAGSHVARFGGDEFALLLPRVNADGAAEVAETVRSRVEALALSAEHQTISVSIGGVSTKVVAELDELIRRADLALYRAKVRGRNRAELESAPVTEQAGELTFVSVG